MQPQPTLQQQIEAKVARDMDLEVGRLARGTYALQAEKSVLQQQLAEMTAERDALKAKYEPAPAEDAEPTPMAARKNGKSHKSAVDQAIDEALSKGG